MKILFLAIPFDHGQSGISVYMKETVQALKAQGQNLTLVLEQSTAAKFPGFSRIILPDRPPLLSMLHCLFILPWKLPFRQFDYCIIPAANRRCFCRFPIFTIAVVHDLSQYHISAKYDCFRMFYIRHLLPFFVRRSPAVCAISPTTAGDLIRHWHVFPGKIHLVPNGLSLFSCPPSSSSATSGSRPYILYISRLEHPGKNHLNLLKAFEMLPADLREKYDLRCPGSYWSQSDKILTYAAQSPCRDHFIFPGFLAQDQLPDLYRGASMYVFPSFYEGFGLSLLEAMHYGIPCACSDRSALRDIGDGAAELFNPEEPRSIAEALRRVLTDSARRSELTAAGKERAAQFSWEKTARGLMRIFQRPGAELLGIPFFAGTMQEALTILDEQITAARQKRSPRRIFFVNAHCLNLACRDQEYHRILNQADAVFADGSGVKLGARMKHMKILENVNGTDMFPLLAERNYSLYLLGGAPGIAAQAVANSRQAHPGIRITGFHDGFFKGHEEEVLADINAADPDILLVAMGVPLQEKWISGNCSRLRCGAVIGVGGLFDFISGRIPRAPALLRKLGLEWTYRLYQEPRRLFRRYIIGNPLFILRILCSGNSSANTSYPRKNNQNVQQ